MFDVTYTPNGVPTETFAELLRNVADHAMNRGLVTSDTEAEVDETESVGGP